MGGDYKLNSGESTSQLVQNFSLPSWVQMKFNFINKNNARTLQWVWQLRIREHEAPTQIDDHSKQSAFTVRHSDKIDFLPFFLPD